MKKRDFLLIGAVLLIALAVLLYTRFFNRPGDSATVTVYVSDQEYCRVSASDYQTITVDQGDGRVNVIVIDENGVHMESSTCKNQLCVQQGTIDPGKADELLLNSWIVCLPNGVTVEVTAAEVEDA